MSGLEFSSKEAVLDHIAIAVKNIEESAKIYEDLGFKFADEREVVESQGVTTAFAHVDENAHIELLEPLGENGAIYDFIQKKGEGIHHICFKVKDVAKKCQELKDKGYRLIYPEPVDGAGNCLVNFIHPKSSNGVLIEVSQKKG